MKNIIITTAGNMSENTYKTICDGFKAKFGTDTVCRRVVDESVIGGFVANVNGEIFDLSIASQLKKMENHITN